MTWITEEPLPILFVGVLIEGFLLIALLQTARRALLYLMIVTGILFGGLLLVEFVVVTDAEEVEMMLDTMAADLERDDLPALLAHISDTAPELQQMARTRLKQVVVSRAAIKGNLQITVRRQKNRSWAIAKFNVVIIASDRTGTVEGYRYARYLVVRLRKQGGRWRMTGFEEHHPLRPGAGG